MSPACISWTKRKTWPADTGIVLGFESGIAAAYAFLKASRVAGILLTSPSSLQPIAMQPFLIGQSPLTFLMWRPQTVCSAAILFPRKVLGIRIRSLGAGM